MEDSIFTKIINRQLPGHIIYEDDQTLAFLDIYPLTEGHTVVVPKKQVQFVWDLEPSDYQALMAVVQKIALHLRKATGMPFIGEQIVGVDVPHAHVHLIPFQDAAILRTTPDRSIEPDHTALATLAQRLALG